MNDIDNEEKFARKIKQAFDESVEQLDTRTISAIAVTRQTALSHSNSRSRWLLVPVGVMATLVFAVSLYLLPAKQSSSDFMAEDLDMLISSEGLEFYEDLEFYEWLDESDLTT